MHSQTCFNDAVESYLRKINHPMPLAAMPIDDLRLLFLKAGKQDVICRLNCKNNSSVSVKINFEQILFHILTRFLENQVVWLS